MSIPAIGACVEISCLSCKVAWKSYRGGGELGKGHVGVCLKWLLEWTERLSSDVSRVLKAPTPSPPESSS